MGPRWRSRFRVDRDTGLRVRGGNFVAVRLSRWGEFPWPAYWPLRCSGLPWPSWCCASRVARMQEFSSRQHREERQNAITSGVAHLPRSLTQIFCVALQANHNSSFNHPLRKIISHACARSGHFYRNSSWL